MPPTPPPAREPDIQRRFECTAGTHYKYYHIQAWSLGSGRYFYRAYYGRMVRPGHHTGTIQESVYPNVSQSFLSEKVSEKLGKGYLQVATDTPGAHMDMRRGSSGLSVTPVTPAPVVAPAPASLPDTRAALRALARQWTEARQVTIRSDVVLDELRVRASNVTFAYSTVRTALANVMADYRHYRVSALAGSKRPVDLYELDPDVANQHVPSALAVRQKIIEITLSARTKGETLSIQAIIADIKAAYPGAWVGQVTITNQLTWLVEHVWQTTYHIELATSMMGSDPGRLVPNAVRAPSRADMLDL